MAGAPPHDRSREGRRASCTTIQVRNPAGGSMIGFVAEITLNVRSACGFRATASGGSPTKQ
jgi:hypothetical protein